MREFGSDFHRLDGFVGTPLDIERLNPVTFADGRLALIGLIQYKGWKRLWIPEYFCYEVVNSISHTGIELAFYPDGPEEDDRSLIKCIPFCKGDALLRMNYFGLRAWRDESELPVDVIEDHSHGLLTDWAQHSNADYCIASLRKIMPIPEGGILWSPKRHILPCLSESTVANDNLVYKRFAAMSLKAIYINSGGDKGEFRRLYIESEKELEVLRLSGMSVFNKQLYSMFDYRTFDSLKKNNWHYLISLLTEDVCFLIPENNVDTPFSLILRFADKVSCSVVRSKLIENSIYPAILWPIPEEHKCDKRIYLSIHCDGRYSFDDMEIIATIINRIYRNE